jgi:hypothetical protein
MFEQKQGLDTPENRRDGPRKIFAAAILGSTVSGGKAARCRNVLGVSSAGHNMSTLPNLAQRKLTTVCLAPSLACAPNQQNSKD